LFFAQKVIICTSKHIFSEIDQVSKSTHEKEARWDAGTALYSNKTDEKIYKYKLNDFE